ALQGPHRRSHAERRDSDGAGGDQGGECDNREADCRHDADPARKHHETSAWLGRAVNGVRAASASAVMTLSKIVTRTGPGESRTRSNPAASATALAPCRMAECANSGGGAKGSDRQTGSTWSRPNRTVTHRTAMRINAKAGAARKIQTAKGRSNAPATIRKAAYSESSQRLSNPAIARRTPTGEKLMNTAASSAQTTNGDRPTA